MTSLNSTIQHSSPRSPSQGDWRSGQRRSSDNVPTCTGPLPTIEAYRQQAERAEQWLYKVYTEIEDRFLDRDKNARRRA